MNQNFFFNIYAPNDPAQQIKFLRDLSTSTLKKIVNEKMFASWRF